MFTCHACARRYVRALTESLSADSSQSGPQLARRTIAARKRFLSHTATTQNDAATAFVRRERSGVPPKAWRNLNAGVEGDKILSWRDAPDYGDVQRAREEVDVQERKEKQEKERIAKERNSSERTGRPRKNPGTTWRDSPESISQGRQREAGLKRTPTRFAAAAPRYTPPEKRSRRLTPGTIQTELKYLHDPVKLADHVKYVLGQDDEEKAVALVRMSSTKAANTVSWNHLIDWQMKRGKTKVAIDTYNEMKKRGQKPDSYTYLLLLRGLAEHAHHPHTLGRALSLYHAMRAGKSVVAPNIIHTNAILKVCSRANDLDSMWDIASQLPDNGPHAANNWTFTTIFNSMRNHALVGTPDHENVEAMARRREETIVDARRLWGPLIGRWRKGDLLVDEDLVCAMGRLLLIGARPRDWDDVLSLLHQTMNIARLVPRLGTAGREESSVPRIRAPNTPSDMKNDASEIVDRYGDSKPGDEFNPVTFDISRTVGVGASSEPQSQLPKSHGSGAGGYAAPSNSTISLIMEACLKMAAKQPARNYWNLLTDSQGHAIMPDMDNVHMYLRILRQSRSSGEAVGLVCDDVPQMNFTPQAKTFRIAMSACSRDARNPHVLEHAARLLEAMSRQLGEPDITTLFIFTNLARDQEALEQLLVAIEKLEPAVTNLRSLLTFAPRDKITDANRQLGLEVIQGLIGCYDKILRLDSESKQKTGTGALSLKLKDRTLQRKTSQAAFVTRWREKELKRNVEGPKASNAGQEKEMRTSNIAAETAAMRAQAATEQKELFTPRRRGPVDTR